MWSEGHGHQNHLGSWLKKIPELHPELLNDWWWSHKSALSTSSSGDSCYQFRIIALDDSFNPNNSMNLAVLFYFKQLRNPRQTELSLGKLVTVIQPARGRGFGLVHDPTEMELSMPGNPPAIGAALCTLGSVPGQTRGHVHSSSGRNAWL